ncbi:MAG: MOSC domain-containing protein [Woeseiaceae bacterium]
MEKINAKVISVHSGSSDDMSKDAHPSIQVDLVGVKGDAHRSYERSTWAGGDKQPEGTTRRNERQWSAVSLEEMAEMSAEMDLTEPLDATCLGANLCLSGVAQLSRLPKGTLLKFPSGAELIVEEYNPPCHYMGEKVASLYTTQSGKPLATTAFSKAAKLKRGIVGVVETAGSINTGDDVIVEVYETPSWLRRSPD